MDLEKKLDYGPSSCPECHGKLIGDHRGDTVCDNCGLVTNDKAIDVGPEWRTFDGEIKASRGMGPADNPELPRDLSTNLGFKGENVDANKHPLSQEKKRDIFFMSRAQIRAAYGGARERAKYRGESLVDKIASQRNLPEDVRNNAKYLYNKATSLHLMRGRSFEVAIAAIIYASCRICGVPRTLDEVSKYIDVPKKEVGRTFRNIRIPLYIRVEPVSPFDYLPRFCAELKLSRETQIEASNILKKIKLVGFKPTVPAATAIYMASYHCGETRTQQEVAEITGITEISIRNAYNKFILVLGQEYAHA